MVLAADGTFDPFASWTVNEEQRKPRPATNKLPPRKAGLTRSSSSAALQSQSRRPWRRSELSGYGSSCLNKRGSTGDSNCSTQSHGALPTAFPAIEDYDDGGYAVFKARFEKEFEQQRRVNRLSVPRRQRLVAETLQVVRDAFDPAMGLEKAAAALEAEALAALRHTAEQTESCCNLAQPKLNQQPAEAKEDAPSRSWVEQQAYVRNLAEPRPTPEPPEFPVPGTPGLDAARTAAEQQRHCAALAQPRAPLPGEQPPGVVAAWREELTARAEALMPEEVQAARTLLEKMRSRPQSAPRKSSVKTCAASATRVEDSEEVLVAVKQMHDAVEEVLWVCLLQMRSCPKGPGGGTPTGGSSLEDRLGQLLLSSIGPALRPVARRVLAPAEGVARRLRTELPRMARHLGIRESEEMQPAPTSWSLEELQSHLAAVRQSRDELLAMDLTKGAVQRLGDAFGTA
mmetsp:Transcript_16279/g.28430  ORF Transcript_16279/g.28430 Transcript_16279/m.28430 type:complete len:457 (+) Transcript_16279:33-1403(+)